MGIGLLAPVPAQFLKSALDICAAEGLVAFGTNAWEVFAKVDEEYGSGIPVLIYATHFQGTPDKLFSPGKAGFRAVYKRVQPATKGGKHPKPSLRPVQTIHGAGADTGWTAFWEITDLVQLAEKDRVPITALTAEGQKKPLLNGFVPKGPMLVKAAFL